MADPLLTPAEVAELTGASRSKGQAEWLIAQGIPCVIGRDGRVKVLWAAVEAKLMPGTARQRKRTEPDLSALPKAS